MIQKRYLPLLFILTTMGAVYLLGLLDYMQFETLKVHRESLLHQVQSHPISSAFFYIALYTLVTALSLPVASYLTLFGGFLFGQPYALIYTVISATFGASCLFLAAKTALGQTLQERGGPLLLKLENKIGQNGASYLLFIRLVPLFPFWLCNLAPAFLNIPFSLFFWTTFFGIIPGTFVFTQIGTGLGSIFDTAETFSIQNLITPQIQIAFIALGLFSLLPILYKKLCKK